MRQEESVQRAFQTRAQNSGGKDNKISKKKKD